jgi:uncharacterized protein (TIGR03435 family)
MRTPARAVLFGLLSSCAVCAQSPQQPQFEVVAVKLGGDAFSTKPQLSPGRFNWTTQIAYLIGYAYSLDQARIFGDVLGGDVYTVTAVFTPKATGGDVRAMLQSLLADRFHLRFHRLSKEADGYAITIAKGGIRMKESAAAEPSGAGGSGSGAPSAPGNDSYLSTMSPSTGVLEITGRGVSVAELAERLGRNTGTPFWDQTGLAGRYDFTFRFAQQDLDADILPDVPLLSTALREDLGLALVKSRGPVETLVIDHIEPPAEN